MEASADRAAVAAGAVAAADVRGCTNDVLATHGIVARHPAGSVRAVAVLHHCCGLTGSSASRSSRLRSSAQERIAEIKRTAGTTPSKVAIVVLGGGREAMAPEYGVSHLKDMSLQRLHYGVWLSRQTGAPLMFSGGVGYGDSVGSSEAEAAARIAERDYGKPLTWSEGESRDTRENAARSIAMLKTAGDHRSRPGDARLPHAPRNSGLPTRSPARRRHRCASGPLRWGLRHRANSSCCDGCRRARASGACGLSVHELAGYAAGRLTVHQRAPKNETPPHHEGGRGG